MTPVYRHTKVVQVTLPNRPRRRSQRGPVDAPTSSWPDVTVTLRRAHRALRRLAVRQPPAPVHGVIGPNGAGKTTLFNVACGFVRARQRDAAPQGRAARAGCAPTSSPASASPAPCRVSACSTGSRVLDNVHGRRRPARPRRLPRRAAGAAALLARGAGPARAGDGHARRPRHRPRRRPLPAAASPTRCASGSRWPGPWSPSPSCCCSTSRPAGSPPTEMDELGDADHAGSPTGCRCCWSSTTWTW